MDWTEELFERLEQEYPCGYARGGAGATEPTALATIALAAIGRIEAAQLGARWIGSLQGEDGSVGPTAEISEPGWPTSLAILATLAAGPWRREDRANEREARPLDVEQATQWLLQAKGKTLAPNATMGHDCTLVGWSWAAATHSWLEPTAMAVLALKHVGQREHPRTVEGVRLLVDRLLPEGGCNYGNTVVLGQVLRPHLQPTGWVLLALAGEPADRLGASGRQRVERSLGYLEQELSESSPSASLAYGTLALTRYGRRPARADDWLRGAYRRVWERDRSPHKLAMLALAATGKPFPLADQSGGAAGGGSLMPGILRKDGQP